MKKSSTWKKYTLLFGVLFLFPLTLVLIFGVFSEHKFNTLPYYGEHQVAAGSTDTSYYRLPEFTFINQEGEGYGLDSLRGKVWLATFYATNSPYIRKITGRLLWPNFRYRGEDDILIVSFTLDPEHDRPPVMKEYVDQMTRYNAFEGKWQFLTGEKQEMFDFYQKAFFLDDPMHTATVWLVDTEGHLRGKYNGNLEEDIRDAIEDIALLKKEIDIQKYEAKKRLEDPAADAPDAGL